MPVRPKATTQTFDNAITDNQIEDDIQTFDLLKIKDGVDISAFNQSVSTTTGASISGETITFNGTSTVEIDGTTLNGYDLSQFTFKTFVNPTTNGGVLMRKELEYNGFIEVRLNADNKLELEISDKPVYDVTAALNDSVVTVSGKTTTNAGATPTIYSVAYTTPQSDKSAIYNDISYSVSVPAGNVLLWASGSSTATLTKVLERTSPSTDPSDLNSYGITGVTNNVYVYTVGLTGDINSLMTGSNTEPYAISENRVQVVAGEDFSILEAINAVSESNTLTTDISVSFSGGYDNYWAFALKNSDAIDLSDANTDLKVQLETFIEQYISMGVAGGFYGTDAVVTGTKHHEYNVSVSGTYQFSGDATGSQPDFTVYPGDILTFNLHETVSGHPFYIKTVQGSGTGNQASGVVNNGSESGVVRWYPTTARTFYYQCGAHGNMYGTITVAQRPPAFVQGATFEYAFESLTSVTPTTLDTEANTYTPVVVAVGSDGKYYMTSGNGVTIEPVVLQKGLIEFDIENATTSSLPNIGTSSTTDASFSILKTAQSVGSDDKGYYIDFTQYDFNTNADRFIFTASTLPYEFSTNGDFTMMYEAMINHTHNGSYPFLFGGDSDRLQVNVSSSQVVLYVGPALVSIPVISYSPGDHIKFVLSSKSAEKEHKIYWHNITTGDIVESGTKSEIFNNPKKSYTRELINAAFLD